MELRTWFQIQARACFHAATKQFADLERGVLIPSPCISVLLSFLPTLLLQSQFLAVQHFILIVGMRQEWDRNETIRQCFHQCKTLDCKVNWCNSKPHRKHDCNFSGLCFLLFSWVDSLCYPVSELAFKWGENTGRRKGGGQGDGERKGSPLCGSSC